MSEPIKKADKTTPESYSPKTPKFLSMMGEAQDGAEESNMSTDRKGQSTMKNSIDFNFRFNGYWPLDFINVFASVMNFEGIQEDQGKLYFLYDTICGHNSLRARFDGVPTEIQKRFGDTAEDENGSDDNVDFLFGFVGYEYRKLTDPGAFKDAVTTSVNAGKPVVAKVKAGSGRFRVIIGYDGDELLEPSYEDICHNKPQKSVEYGELETLYIVGDKIRPRYTLKDGLERIRQVMEYNAAEKIWDGWIEKFTWDSFCTNDDIEEKQACVKRVADRMWNMNTWAFGNGLNNRIHEELRNPEFDNICKQACDSAYNTWSDYWSLIGLAECADWNHRAFKGGEIYVLVRYALEHIKKCDAEVLEFIKQAIAVLGEKSGEDVTNAI